MLCCVVLCYVVLYYVVFYYVVLCPCVGKEHELGTRVLDSLESMLRFHLRFFVRRSPRGSLPTIHPVLDDVILISSMHPHFFIPQETRRQASLNQIIACTKITSWQKPQMQTRTLQLYCRPLLKWRRCSLHLLNILISCVLAGC